MQLLNPTWLLALIPVVGVLLYAFFKTNVSKADLLLRTLVFTLLIFALSRPAAREQHSQRHISAMVDVSKSISPRATAAVVDTLRAFTASQPDTQVLLFPFADKLSTDSLLISADASKERISGFLQAAAEKLDSGETNIGQSITDAVAKGSSSLLLLSDGYETAGDAPVAARAAAAKGVSVFPLIPDESAFIDEGLTISSLYSPLTVEAGNSLNVRTSIKNGLSDTASAKLEVWLENEKLLSQKVSVEASSEKLFQVKTPPINDGLKRIRSVLYDNSDNIISEQHRWVSVKSKSKLLVLSGVTEDARVLPSLLTQKGYAIEAIVTDGSKAVPTDLSNYSLVIINNVAKHQLPAEFLPALEKHVNGGAGLLIIGGDRSYGLGGYIDSPLEKLSPLKFVPPQTKKRRLNSAVVLVIDKSRSMVFYDKILAAKRAALAAIDTLKDDDFVGVIGFDSAPFVIIKLSPVTEVKPMAERRLRNLTAAGKTNLLPAMVEARRSLQNSNAGRKHIIVLSDGEIPQVGSQYPEEIQRIRSAGISVTAVALGLEADVPFMKMMSELGGGAFYHTLEPSQLPEIFVRDIKVSVGEKTLKEKQLFSVNIGPAGLLSSTVDIYPALGGFVETLPKPGGSLELVTRSENRVFPVLASWAYGAGKVVAFTSDANGRWSDRWVPWDEFALFWGQVIDGIKNKGSGKEQEFDFDLRYSINRKSLELDLAIFDSKLSSQAAPTITAQVVEPGGERTKVVFQGTKKGRFRGVLADARPGDYRIEVAYGNIKLPPLALTISGDVFGEHPGRGLNVQNLAQIAHLSGGAINPNLSQLSTEQRHSEEVTEMFIPLLVLAALLLLFEAFIREVGLGIFNKLNFFRFFSGKNNKTSPRPLAQGQIRKNKSLGARTSTSAREYN